MREMLAYRALKRMELKSPDARVDVSRLKSRQAMGPS